MGKRLPNPRLAKIHRSYTVDEVASLYGVHRGTVRQWIKAGLPTCDTRRPLLILGSALAAFLTTKRTRNKRPCAPGEFYCLRCRTPRVPALCMADYRPLTATGGNLVGLCPVCECLIYRRVSLAKLGPIQAFLDITLPHARDHIDDSRKPCLNSDFNKGARTHGKAQHP
jgi:excisionase family DNA binding protein